MTVPALSAPPCTATLRVEKFDVQTDAGLRISDKGFHPLGVAEAMLESMTEARWAERDRFKQRVGGRFERALRQALESNARDLLMLPDVPPALTVSGTLFYRQQHDVRFEKGSGLGTESESEGLTESLDAHLVVSDASGTVVAETTVNLSGPAALKPVTPPKYGTPLDIWRAVEHLVRRRVRFEVPLAWAWSREVRGGMRAADKGDWETAIRYWMRATSATSPTTRRAAHFNLFIAHEIAGRFEEARAHLVAAQEDRFAAVGYMSASSGEDPEGQRTVTPNEYRSHLWRLGQYEIGKRCELGP